MPSGRSMIWNTKPDATQNRVFEPNPVSRNRQRPGILYIEGLPHGFAPSKLDKNKWLCPAAQWEPAPCHRIFKSSESAKAHYLKHLGIRLLCGAPGCGLSYSDRPALHKHMVKDHGYVATGSRAKKKNKDGAVNPSSRPQSHSGISPSATPSSSHGHVVPNAQPRLEQVYPLLYPLTPEQPMHPYYPTIAGPFGGRQSRGLPNYGGSWPRLAHQDHSASIESGSTPLYKPTPPLVSNTSIDYCIAAVPPPHPICETYVPPNQGMTFDELMSLFEPVHSAGLDSSSTQYEAPIPSSQHTGWGTLEELSSRQASTRTLENFGSNFLTHGLSEII